MQHIDVLIDGRWQQQYYNPKLLWAGSSNQRVIDVKASMQQGKVILYTNNLA